MNLIVHTKDINTKNNKTLKVKTEALNKIITLTKKLNLNCTFLNNNSIKVSFNYKEKLDNFYEYCEILNSI
jgi:hypothetical protein